MKIVRKNYNIVDWLKKTGDLIIAQEHCHFGKQGVLVRCGDSVVYGTDVRKVVNVLISNLPESLSVENNFTDWSWAPMIDFESWVGDNDYEIIVSFSSNPEITDYYKARIIGIADGSTRDTEKDAIISLACMISANNKYPCFKIWDLL